MRHRLRGRRHGHANIYVCNTIYMYINLFSPKWNIITIRINGHCLISYTVMNKCDMLNEQSKGDCISSLYLSRIPNS